MKPSSDYESLAIVCNAAERLAQAQQLASDLGVALLQNAAPVTLAEPAQVLLFDTQGLSLQTTGRKAPGPIQVDFTSGGSDHRRKFGGGKGQMVAKAVGLKGSFRPQIVDATAGLGGDAFVLATLGCRMTLLERSPVVYALLADGLQRGRQWALTEDRELVGILDAMTLVPADAQQYLTDLSQQSIERRPDVVYLDPMFPERIKSASVKKEMAAFHTLVGRDEDAVNLLELALAVARYRVVVKRPTKAPLLADYPCSYQLEGKSTRFDIYTIKKMPD